MEETKYKVLWLDDDFQPNILNPDSEQKKINLTRDTLREDADVATNYNLIVDCVYSRDEFYKKLQSYQQYQAVIFDLKGLDLDDSTEDSPMPDAYEKVKNLPLAVYVYSGNPEDPVFKITLKELKARGRVFGKLDGPDKMFEKIYDDLDVNFNYYCGHRDCLNLFTEGYLTFTVKEYMDVVLESYSKKNEICPLIYNSIRQLLESMMEHLVETGVIDSKQQTLNKRLDYLTEYYEQVYSNELKKNVADYSKPLVPFSICPMEIKYAFSFLGNMTNFYSHYLKEHPEYLLKNETTREYNILIQDSVYPAFFAVVKWYHAFMSKHA